MAATLHSALQSLGPAAFDEMPSSPTDLRTYIQDLLTKSRLIIESVPPPPPAPRNTTTHDDLNPRTQATSSSEISGSSARAPPPPRTLQHEVLQKEWGRQVNKTGSTNKKEKAQNPLDIPVYKLAGKDGKGAWFGRRSVHEGLGFQKWKQRLEGEFEETLKIRREKEIEKEKEGLGVGAVPGDGNIRGIGGEKRVERVAVREADAGIGEGDSGIDIEGNGGKMMGKVEVYHLSAQFPGPTAPRDFVTLLITSDVTLEVAGGRGDGGAPEKEKNHPPRSYMIISKPCDHPDTPAREGFIRGQYESVEFIREIPVSKNRSRKTYFANKSESDILDSANHEAEEMVTGRRRGKTVTNAQPPLAQEDILEDDPGGEVDEEAEQNPVEWIMITRSDPGGSVPRWMVERGTPGSIVADAAKFLDWACQEGQDEEGARNIHNGGHQSLPGRRKSSTGPGMNGNLARLESNTEEVDYGSTAAQERREKPLLSVPKEDSYSGIDSDDDDDEYGSTQNSGLMASVTGMVNAGLEMYTPQSILNYMPGQSPRPQGSSSAPAESRSELQNRDVDDDASISSTATFASAASHADGTDLKGVPISIQRSSSNPTFSHLGVTQNTKGPGPATTGHTPNAHIPEVGKPEPTSQGKELAKLAARKREAEDKLAATRAEFETIPAKPDTSSQGSKENQGQTLTSGRPESSHSTNSNKAEQQQQRKRASTLTRTESKLVSQIEKLESQQVKLTSKIEARQRKQAARDDRAKGKLQIESLNKEVERLRNEVNDLRGEREGWVNLVGRLQKENTRLVAEAGGGGGGGSPGRIASRSIGSG